ncbi:hypothetical protein HELRODRAFT_194728 [Helobdella robusta]|uniref:Uncharacterized protein n=1 Tax=Helobdella robusta TaxID=6412 RepID=T1FWC7_HELRO|nr:hypothetical protein HELRODRAFT_194728 [Helobdella robusta]ESN90026.1 hypothetical protein HELRODRAFT_194728 [Helobdella robusta]
MCMKTQCEKCQKTTWKGCGKHVEEVMKDVPESERCTCPRGEHGCGGHGQEHGCHGEKGHATGGHCGGSKGHCGQKK